MKYTPNPKMLEKAGLTEALPFIMMIPSYRFGVDENGSDKDNLYLSLFTNIFSNEYGGGFTPGHGQPILGEILNEMLKNAMEHGNKFDPKKYATIAVWFGKRGVVFGFRDEGDFFSLKSTKGKMESRIPIESTRAQDPSGLGTLGLCEVADEIHVNTEEKTLYVLYMIKT